MVGSKRAILPTSIHSQTTRFELQFAGSTGGDESNNFFFCTNIIYFKPIIIGPNEYFVLVERT